MNRLTTVYVLLIAVCVFTLRVSASDQHDFVTLRYVLPAGALPADKSSAPKWHLAAPISDDYSDPNQIVYDDAYLREYVDWAVKSPTECGAGNYWITTKEGVEKLSGGEEQLYLGNKFRADDLVRFLETRVESMKAERVTRIKNPDAARILREQPEFLDRRLTRSPWDRDTQAVVILLSKARHKPTHSLYRALLKDSSLSVRRSVTHALGNIAPAVPEAVDDLVRLLDDKELRSDAVYNLALAGEVAIPAITKALDHPDPAVRNCIVFALGRMPPKLASPMLIAATQNSDAEMRHWALAVLADLTSSRGPLAGEPYIDALAKRLSDSNRQVRRKAALALSNMKRLAAPAKTALQQSAANDEDQEVRNLSTKALAAIQE